MSFLRRAFSGRPEPEELAPTPAAPSPAPEASAAIVGDQRCSLPGCPREDAVACSYTDRRGRSCPTAWCPDHQQDVDRSPYCRRHSGVVRALLAGDSLEHAQGPDIDSRAPSLAEWVGNQVDVAATGVLNGLKTDFSGVTMIAEPLSLVITGTPRVRRWQRAWKLSGHTGVIIKIAIGVDENRDHEVIAMVDGEEVGRTVPPWIANRVAGQAPSPEEDANQRAAFQVQLLDFLGVGIQRRRPYLDALL
ncbi:MAG: hypothetical protein ACYDGR_00725 [Candidatus Dormibacteria bacterium]